MTGRGIATLVVAASLAAVVAVSPPTARADVVTPAPYLNSAAQTNLDSFLRTTNGTYYGRTTEMAVNSRTTANAKLARTSVWRARLAAGQLPKLPTLGTITLAASALTIGWQIGRAIDTHWLKLSAAPTFGTTAATGAGSEAAWALKWVWHGAGITRANGSNTGPVWRLEWTGTSTGSQDNFLTGCSQTGGCPNIHKNAVAVATALGIGTFEPVIVNSTGCSGTGYPNIGTCNAYVASPTVIETQFTVADHQTTTPSWAVTRTTNIADPGAVTTAGRDAARAMLGESSVGASFVNHVLHPDADYPDPTLALTMPDCAGLTVAACTQLLQDAGHTGTITEVDLGRQGAVLTRPAGAVVTTSPGASTTLDVGTAVTLNRNPNPLPIELPAPLPNETHAAYITRLQSLGYVGTVTIIELGLDQTPTWSGPAQPVYVGTPYGTTTLVPNPAPAGAPTPAASPPRVNVSDPITLRVGNPNAVPVPDDALTAPACPCPIRDVNLQPLLDVECNDKFPCGVFTWAMDWLGSLTTTPVTPELTYSIAGTHGANGAVPGVTVGEDLTLSLAAADEYAAWWRTMVAFVFTLGIVWYVGSRMLGVRESDDVSDEVFERPSF